MTRRLAVLLFGAASLLLAASAQPAQGGPPALSLRYTFDGWWHGSVTDVTGRYPLQARGDLEYVRRGEGWAARFPPRCTEGDCPRVILEGTPAPELNPGTRGVRFGASVLMTAADTGDGANVVQKGFSTGGVTQLKLQVDGRAGQPSCVVASKTTIYRAVARVNVADGRWHALACFRSGRWLAIEVDGTQRAAVTMPPSVSIVNSEPLRIGGKSVSVDNDQYAGQLDDVFLTID
ncbi:LamG-like jellyroll fold domain-containing protein [Phytohabitans sp. ZYX-F-186]|uniref:LamG-like jellyroll fold domain-containing protein n=1 Tax=Phytohabitans maris TaxID=3071409 RepID=A0ABU0ZVQ4_9ACTN|nr:LamG-like jellyroll fold domain-containing protein [Phytohabitans sp. ZYX-F-186]MDQ7910280.1 LamG-like jellyroll fold domain-containing protein [Phytohabitans sp. ZYX-F-186]